MKFVSDAVALTYRNDRATDGMGAQFQRIYGIYALSRIVGLPYIHTPVERSSNQGLRQMMIGSFDADLLREHNEVLTIPSDVNREDYPHVIEIGRPEPGFQEAVIREAESTGRKTLVQVIHPYGFLDKQPDSYGVCKAVSPFRPAVPAWSGAGPVRVAIHVRRGDLHIHADEAVKKARILPNSYYIDVCLRLAKILNELDIPARFELHTEIAEQAYVVKPGDWVPCAVKTPVRITPEDDNLADFDAIPNLERCYNEKSLLTLEKFATADILVLSKSSFSYFPATLNTAGIIIYPRFWHAPMSDWVIAAPDATFNEAQVRALIQARREAAAFSPS